MKNLLKNIYILKGVSPFYWQVGRLFRRIIPKPILSAIRYMLKTLMRFPFWTYLAFRKYIPGYELKLSFQDKKLPHYLQEGVAIFMCFVTVLVGTGLIFLFGPWATKKTEAAWLASLKLWHASRQCGRSGFNET